MRIKCLGMSLRICELGFDQSPDGGLGMRCVYELGWIGWPLRSRMFDRFTAG